jgi:hypothetical protein
MATTFTLVEPLAGDVPVAGGPNGTTFALSLITDNGHDPRAIRSLGEQELRGSKKLGCDRGHSIPDLDRGRESGAPLSGNEPRIAVIGDVGRPRWRMRSKPEGPDRRRGAERKRDSQTNQRAPAHR